MSISLPIRAALLRVIFFLHPVVTHSGRPIDHHDADPVNAKLATSTTESSVRPIGTVDDVDPANALTSWTLKDVDAWLKTAIPDGAPIERFRTLFRENNIDGSMLANLSLSDLQDMGIRSLGHRKNIIKAVGELTKQLGMPEAESAVCSSQPTPAASTTSDSVSDSLPQVLSTRPRVYYFPNFISHEDADDIRARAEPHIEPSRVGVIGVSATTKDSMRKSKSTFLNITHAWADSMQRMRSKIARSTHRHGTFDKLQVVRYGEGEYYRAHLDSEDGIQNKRVATVIVFLSDVEEGGETMFPLVPTGTDGRWADGKETKAAQQFGIRHFDDLCSDGDVLKVRPRKGAAAVFYTVKPDSKVDPLSLHGSCMVRKGVKWVAQQWIHEDIPDVRASDDVQALYLLDELRGTSPVVIPDTSRQGHDMTLIKGAASVTSTRGVLFKGGATACSSVSSSLMHEIKNGHSLTLALWVRIGGIKDRGRQNILTLSSAPEDGKKPQWRFSIWQQGSDVFIEGPGLVPSGMGEKAFELFKKASLQKMTWVHLGLVSNTVHKFEDSLDDVTKHWSYTTTLLINGEPLKTLAGSLELSGLGWSSARLCAGPNLPEQIKLFDIVMLSRALSKEHYDWLYKMNM